MVVVVKIGTSSLTDSEGSIRKDAIVKLCDEVATVRATGHSVVIVTSGAIGAGLPALGLGGANRPTDSRTLQAVSAVGQSRLMGVYCEALDQHSLVGGQVLLAPLDFVDRRQYLQARGTLTRLLELGVVPIVNENDAVADEDVVRPTRKGDRPLFHILSTQNFSYCSPIPLGCSRPIPASIPMPR